MKYVALVRGINVGGHKKLPMAALREVCNGIGWKEVVTYIQSGNLVFQAKGKVEALEGELEKAIERRFGFEAPVVVRGAMQWAQYIDSNPLLALAKKEPNRVMLALAKKRPAADAVESLSSKAKGGERIVQVGDALWIYYHSGVASTKLAPGLLDRVVGAPVTTRNWQTVVTLGEWLDKEANRR